MKKIVDTVESMNVAIQGFIDMDEKRIDKGYNESFKNEREADEIKKKILDELAKGIFHPINRDAMIRLTMTADEIAANAKAAARKLSFMDSKKIHVELREIIKLMAAELVKIVSKTFEAFVALMDNPKTAIAISHEVERIEEQVDDIRTEQLVPETLVWNRRIQDISLVLLLKEITDNMEGIADICEDVSDIIRLIAISYK